MKRQVWDQDPRLVLHSSSQHWKRGITPSIKPPINGAAATADSHSWGWNFRPNYLHSQISGDLQFISSSSHLEPHRGKFPPFFPFRFLLFHPFLALNKIGSLENIVLVFASTRSKYDLTGFVFSFRNQPEVLLRLLKSFSQMWKASGGRQD